MDRRTFVRVAGGVVTGTTVGVAGCSQADSAESTSAPASEATTEGEGAETVADCQPPGDSLDDALPESDRYELAEDVADAEFTPDAGEYEGNPGEKAVALRIVDYTGPDGERYRFIVIEYTTDQAPRDWASAGTGATDFPADREMGYILVDEYAYGVIGPDREGLRDFIETAPPLSACGAEAIQFFETASSTATTGPVA